MSKSIRWILTGILAATTMSLGAQTGSGKVSGTVLDPSGQPLSSATVILLKAADSSMHKTAVTGKDGGYLLKKSLMGITWLQLLLQVIPKNSATDFL
ncbi:MAG: carboxypeptidase regulatory-like domain-containing protein [Chitinophagaceae bacterium]|nr:carboxypeptidase regulatory-like domain-containing protein [Chitinophagaceae bacterium]